MRRLLLSDWLRDHDAQVAADARREMLRAVEAFVSAEIERLGWDGAPGLIGNWIGGIKEAAREARVTVREAAPALHNTQENQ